MNRLFTEMDRTFEQLRSGWMQGNAFGPTPALEAKTDTDTDSVAITRHPTQWNWNANTTTSLKEEDGSYVFVMDLPGFETEEIDLRFDDGHLQIAAQTGDNADVTGSDVHAVRHTSRQFRQAVPIPKPVNATEISASYHNGVLEVTLPLLEADADNGHQIEIE